MYFLKLLSIACAVAATTVSAAPAKPGPAHAKPPAEGVVSLDVYADGNQLHLLTVRRTDEASPPVAEYVRSTDGGETWSAPVSVAHPDLPPPVGARRGMDVQLVAAGEKVLAAWTIYNAEHRFGRGRIATAISADGGKSWRPGSNPADDQSEGDHAFLDLAADSQGVFHAAWLDSRSGRKGLIYAQSADGGATWSRNVVLDGESCECCWNAITTIGRRVLVLYRDKGPDRLAPAEAAEPRAPKRDMAVIASPDGGKTWGTPVSVGDFNWQFDGCPHVGGAIAASTTGDTTRFFATVWTGKAEQSGAYVLSSAETQVWNAPVKLGQNSMRSDIAIAADGRVAAVWDAMVEGKAGVFAAVSADGGKTWLPPQRLGDPAANATYPRLTATKTGFRAIWTQCVEGEPDVWRSRKL